MIDAYVASMILSMFTVTGGTHGFARVERNTQRLVIIVLGTAAVKLANKKLKDLGIRFFRFPRDKKYAA